jgi:hypothetical protein
VDCERRSVRLVTEYRDGRSASDAERTTVVFDGVEAYSFGLDIPGQNILFDISVVDTARFLTEHQDEFKRNYGWPGFWNGSLDDAGTYLAEADVRGYEIESSSGLCGWIVAREMLITASDAAPAG